MEKDSRKNKKIHKNVGLFKSAIKRRANKKIREREYLLKRPLTAQEKRKILHEASHDFQTQLAVRTGAVALLGLVSFSAGMMLNEGSGKIEGVTQENPKAVTVDANNFKDSIKVVGLGDEGVLLVQNEEGQDVQITTQNVNDIKVQNDLVAQREAEIQQIKDDIKNLNSETEVLEYIKKFYREQYAEKNGRELTGNIKIKFYGCRNLNPDTVDEIIITNSDGEVIDSWNGEKNNESAINANAMIALFNKRMAYLRHPNSNQYQAKKGGIDDKAVEAIIHAKGLDEEPTQQVEGIEPGE